MGSDMMNKTEKIGWFEKKLNKWVRTYEESEKDNGNRHNDMIDKINEVEQYSRKNLKGLDKRVKTLETTAGISPGGDGSDMGRSSDNISDFSG